MSDRKKTTRVDLKVGYQCNNRCLFCVQGEKRDILPSRDFEEIKNILMRSYKEGVRGAVLTGGEPTLHPRIIDIIKFSKHIGFKEIQIQTNGRMFAYQDFCLEVIKAGATEFSPSLHGHTAKIHDFLTSAKGSFEQTVAGIQNLKRLKQHVITNTVITSQNYRFLPQIAKLLVSLGVDQLQFAFIHIVGRADENKNRIVPRKSEIMPFVKKGLNIGIKAGKQVMTEAIPICFMGGYEDYIAEKVIPETAVYDIDFKINNYSDYRKNQGKKKGPLCPDCRYFKNCEGPWKEYPEKFGWDEFKPVSKNKF